MPNFYVIFLSFIGQFDNDDSVHTQMIRTIYRQLTSSTVDPPRFGNHWDDIGFQGEPFYYLQQVNF